jgi:hypothetical protein
MQDRQAAARDRREASLERAEAARKQAEMIGGDVEATAEKMAALRRAAGETRARQRAADLADDR